MVLQHFMILHHGIFACLGHGILDIDTDSLLDISYGEFITTNISSIVKGEKGKPR